MVTLTVFLCFSSWRTFTLGSEVLRPQEPHGVVQEKALLGQRAADDASAFQGVKEHAAQDSTSFLYLLWRWCVDLSHDVTSCYAFLVTMETTRKWVLEVSFACVRWWPDVRSSTDDPGGFLFFSYSEETSSLTLFSPAKSWSYRLVPIWAHLHVQRLVVVVELVDQQCESIQVHVVVSAVLFCVCELVYEALGLVSPLALCGCRTDPVGWWEVQQTPGSKNRELGHVHADSFLCIFTSNIFEADLVADQLVNGLE